MQGESRCKMNSYERLFNRLEGKPVDRVPNSSIVMAFAAKYIGVSYKTFVTDYKVLCEAMLRCHEDFKLDVLSAISDPVREAEAFGAKVIFPENSVPYVREPLIKDICNISFLKISEPSKCNRMNDRLMAIYHMAQKAKKECAVQGWIEGGFAEACDIRGINNIMTDIIDEPNAVEELLGICTEQAIKFAIAQIEAGADIIGVGDAAASLIGPVMYEQFALPYEKKIIDAIHNAGAKAKIHICGNINSILELVATTNADIVDCDWMVDFKKASDVFSSKISPCGNFDPVSILLSGSVKDVKAAVEKCLSETGGNSIIAAGCEVPRETPFNNLLEIFNTISSL